MKTITINVYSFDELSEKAKRAALMSLADVNTDHNWHEGIYEDAENVGLKITSFDIDRNEITGELVKDAEDVANLIKENHGPDTRTWAHADVFLTHYLPEKEKWETANPGWYFKYEDAGTEHAELFLKSLLPAYLKMLKTDYNDLTSEERIIETIHANEYLFFEEGKLIPAKYYAMIPGNEAF